MADGKKTLEKPMADLLMPGEQLLGGCKAAGKNAVAKSVGGAATAMLAGSGTTGGMSAAVPQDKVFWVGVTNQRLVYFGVGMMTSAPKSLRGEIPLDAVTRVEVKRQTISRRMTFSFTDGSAASVDLYRASSPDSLQQALEQLLPGRVTEAS